MDLSTHWITLASIVIGLGLTEMFGNLQRLIRKRREVRWDALPLVWVAFVLIVMLNYWWGIALGYDGSRKAETAAEFGLLLASPVLLFLACGAVLPSFEAGDDLDMRRAYASERKVVALTFTLYQLSNWALSLFAGNDQWTYVTVLRAVVGALFLSMLFTNSRRWDWVVVIASIALLVFRTATQYVR